MSVKKKMIPFSWLPASWGLSGKTRQLAEAEYTLDGEELERRKLEINIAEKSEKDIQVASLELDKKYGKIGEIEFDEKRAKVLDEPYVRVARIITDPNDPAFGGIVLDWNKAFVVQLEEHGYGPHPTDEETVNEWFNDLCKNIALEAFSGQGELDQLLSGLQRKEKRGGKADVVVKRTRQQNEE